MAIAVVQPGTIQITEPQTLSISTADIPGLGDLMESIPLLSPILVPPIGVAVSFDLNFQCPMNVYCNADTPCVWQKSYVLPFYLPIPKFAIPGLSLNIPVLSFSIQVPPPIFVTCPAFPDSDWETNRINKDKPEYVEPDKIVVRDPNTPSMSIADDALNNNTTVLNIFSLWS